MKYEQPQNIVKNAFCDMSLSYNGQKKKEIEFYETYNVQNFTLCNDILLENAENLEKYATIAEKSLENAVTEKGATLAGALLMATYSGIRIKCAPQLMFEKYMYLKEQIPKLYYDKNKSAHTTKFLTEMRRVNNIMEDKHHKDIKIPIGKAMIDAKICQTHPLSELKSKECKDKGMSLLPIYIADAYAKLLPRKDMTEKQKKYISSARQIIDDMKALRITNPNIEKQIRELKTKCSSWNVYKEETGTEYKIVHPQALVILEYLEGSYYLTDLRIHELLHKEMTEEEKKAYGVSREDNIRYIKKHLLPAIFIYIPLAILKKVFIPAVILILLKVVFHVNVLDLSRGIFSLIEGIGALLAFVIHHPIISIFTIFFIVCLPDDFVGSLDKSLFPPLEKAIYHDVWFETKMPRDIQGFDVNAYAMHLRHGGEPIYGHHSLDDQYKKDDE